MSLDYEALMKAADEQGVPPNLVIAYYTANASNPEAANIDPAKIVQGIGMASNVAQTGKFQLPQQLSNVEVTGQRPRLPTSVNPYAGTTQETRNPETPNAASISQFDPAALQAAQAAFDKERAAGSGYRDAANILAGFGLGTSGGATTKYNEDLQKRFYDQAYDRTLGAQKRLQDQATAGEAAVTSAQAREVAAGQYMGTQRQKQLELDLKGMDVATRKKLNDPNSNPTKIAKEMFVQQLAVSGKVPTKEQVEMLKNATAEEIMGFMDPKVMDAFKARAGLQKSAAETAQAYGQAYQATGEGGRIRAATPGVAATSDITRAAAASTIGEDGKLKPIQGSNTSIQAGPLAITPSPLTTGQQTAGAEASATDQKQATISTNARLPELSSDLLKVATMGDSSPTGLASPWMSRLTPGQMEQAKARLNQVVAAKMQMEQAAGLNTIKDKEAEVFRMSTLSRGAFQSEMARMNEQTARQQELLKSRDAYLKDNGTLSGFNPDVVNRKTYLVNPKTGQAILDNLTPEQIKQAQAGGYKTTDEINQQTMRK